MLFSNIRRREGTGNPEIIPLTGGAKHHPYITAKRSTPPDPQRHDGRGKDVLSIPRHPSCCCEPPSSERRSRRISTMQSTPPFPPLCRSVTVHFPLTNQSSGRDNLLFPFRLAPNHGRGLFPVVSLGVGPPRSGVSTRRLLPRDDEVGVCLFGEGDLHWCGAVHGICTPRVQEVVMTF